MLPNIVKKWGQLCILLSFFNLNFNYKFIYICSSFLNKTAQLIHLTKIKIDTKN